MSEKQFLEQVRQHQGIIYKLVGLYANDAEEKGICTRKYFYRHGRVGLLSGRMLNSAPGCIAFA